MSFLGPGSVAQRRFTNLELPEMKAEAVVVAYLTFPIYLLSIHPSLQ